MQAGVCIPCSPKGVSVNSFLLEWAGIKNLSGPRQGNWAPLASLLFLDSLRSECPQLCWVLPLRCTRLAFTKYFAFTKLTHELVFTGLRLAGATSFSAVPTRVLTLDFEALHGLIPTFLPHLLCSYEPSCCSSNTPSLALPQGLCTSCPLYSLLRMFFLQMISMACSLLSDQASDVASVQFSLSVVFDSL